MDRAIVVRRGEARRMSGPFGDIIDWVAGEDATANGFSIHERVAPPGASSSPHVHSQIVEAFYVLGGEFRFTVAGENVEAAEGTFILVPRGVEHAWRTVGESEARALLFFSPSAKLAFFEEQHAFLSAGALTANAMQDLARRYGWD